MKRTIAQTINLIQWKKARAKREWTTQRRDKGKRESERETDRQKNEVNTQLNAQCQHEFESM